VDIAYFEKAIKPEFLEDGLDIFEEWFDIEFDNLEEWTLFHSSMMSQLITFVSACTTKSFECVIGFLESTFRGLNEAELACQGRNDQNNRLTHLTKQYHLFQLLYHAVCNTLTESPHQETVGLCLRLYEQITQWDPKMMMIMRQKMKCLSSSTLLLKYCDSQHVMVAFEVMFKHMDVFIATEEANYVGKLRYDNVFNDWAECFSNMTQQCLQHIVSSHSFTLAVLEQVNDP